MKQEIVAGTKQDEANLILRLYEMRRDEEFRLARQWFDTEFDPQSAEDVAKLFAGGFAASARLRMVLSYWEMVAALVNYGAIDVGLLHKTNVEHFRYYAKLEPFITEIRQIAGADFLIELEELVKTATDYEQRLAGWRELSKHWTKPSDQNPEQ